MVLFWRQGYEGTAIAQLTKAMHITAPSLYAAFGSKEQLYSDVLELYLSTHADFLTRALEAPGAVRDAIGQLLTAAAQQFTRNEWPSGCLAASGSLHCAQENRSVAKATAALRRMGQDAIASRLALAVRGQELPFDTDTEGLAAFYAAIIQGMSVQAIDGASYEQLLRIGALAMAAWP
jgi:AcrR family transcriptional regulator